MSRLSEALEHARKVSELYGLNVIGNSLALLQKAREYQEAHKKEDPEEELDFCDVWSDIGFDLLREDSQGSYGHMSARDVEVMEAECRELIEVITEELDTYEQICTALRGSGHESDGTVEGV